MTCPQLAAKCVELCINSHCTARLNQCQWGALTHVHHKTHISFLTHSLCVLKAWSHAYLTCIHPSSSLVIDANFFCWSSVVYPSSVVSLWSLR